MKNLIRGIWFAWQSFRRDLVVSLGATFVMVLTLFVVSTVAMIGFLGDFVSKELKQKIDITIYFSRKASREEVMEVSRYVDSLPEVKETQYVSQEEALAKFKEENADDASLMAGLEAVGEQNPISSYLSIKAFAPEQYAAINDAVDIEEYDSIIDSVDYLDSKVAIDKLMRITRTLQDIAIGLSVIFGFVSVLVIFNTIRLAIYSSREEIEIMKLVGASNWFVRWPFIVEGMLYGIIASIITTALLYPIFDYANPRFAGFFESNALNLTAYYMSNWHIILGLLACAGVILGVISSTIAIGRYLKK